MAEEEIYQVDINGKIYDLQDETARKDNVYSTQETDTGKKWINGKTIYRRVIEVTNKTVYEDTEIARLTDYKNIDYITYKYDAVVSIAPHITTTGFYSRKEEGGSITLKMYYTADTGRFLGISSDKTFLKIYITIEYTKKID